MYNWRLYFLCCSLLLIKLAPLAQSQCRSSSVDLMFIVDGTPAIGSLNFTLAKSFISDFVEKFDIGITLTRVALVQFTPMLRPEFYFNTYFDKPRIKSAINQLVYSPCINTVDCYGQININQSLPYALTLAVQRATGDRADVPDIIVILTVGQNQPSRDLIQINRENTGPFYVFVVAIGKESQNVEFSGSGITMQLFRIDRFDQLPIDVAEPLCRAIVGALIGINTSPGNCKIFKFIDNNKVVY